MKKTKKKKNVLTKRADDYSNMNRWFVLGIVSMVTMLDFGIIFAFGAMFVDMMETFHSNRSSTATVQSLLVGISLSFSIVSGALITRFGIHAVTFAASLLVPFGFCISFFVEEVQYLYITISVIAGIGISTIHVISIVVIQHMFPPRLHPVCFAVHGVAVNIAGIFYPLLIERLLNKYGVHGTFLILGGMFMNSFAIALLLKNKKLGKNQEGVEAKLGKNTPDGRENSAAELEKLTKETEHNGFPEAKSSGEKDNLSEERNDVKQADSVSVSENRTRLTYSSLRTKQYILLLTASALCIPALNAFLGLTVDVFVWKGFTVSQGLFSFVPFNVLSLLSKFIPVLAKKCKKRPSCFVLPLCFCISGLLSQFLVYFSSNYIIMVVGTSLVGLSLGGVFPAMLIAGAKIVSKQEWPVASGLLMTAIGVFSSGLGPIFGLLRDRSGTYTGAIIIIGILQSVGAVLYMFALIIRKNEFIRNKQPQNLQ